MKSILLIFLLLFVETVPGTILDEKDLKVTSYNKKKQHQKSPKKVFIRSYKALFEVFEEASAKTSGSKKERANRTTFTSGTSTRMGVQISGVDVADFQKIIDQSYQDFVNQLTSQGFEIMTAAEASQSDYFEGWKLMKGGASSDDQAAGFVMVTPTGFDYLVKGVAKSGREKGTFLDMGPKISKELGDVYVADVNFIFPFVTLDADASMWTNTSSVKAKIGYRIEPIMNTSQENQQTSLTGFAKGFGSMGSSEVISSQVRFLSGNDIGNNPFFDAKVELKKAVYFEDVFEDKKIKEVTQAQSDMFSKTSYTQLVMVSGDQSTVASHFAECDSERYVSSASGAMKDMVDAGISNFVEMTKD